MSLSHRALRSAPFCPSPSTRVIAVIHIPCFGSALGLEPPESGLLCCLSFSEKMTMSQRPVLSLKQLTLKQRVAYPDQKPCLYCLVLCLYATNIIGGQNANCRGGQGAAGERQSCLWVWEGKAAMPLTEAAVGCQALVSGTLHKLHFVSYSLRAPANSVKHRFCRGRVSGGFFLFLWGLGFFRKAHWIIFLCKAGKIRNRKWRMESNYWSQK